jgi:hypothetical protein
MVYVKGMAVEAVQHESKKNAEKLRLPPDRSLKNWFLIT